MNINRKWKTNTLKIHWILNGWNWLIGILLYGNDAVQPQCIIFDYYNNFLWQVVKIHNILPLLSFMQRMNTRSDNEEQAKLVSFFPPVSTSYVKTTHLHKTQLDSFLIKWQGRMKNVKICLSKRKLALFGYLHKICLAFFVWPSYIIFECVGVIIEWDHLFEMECYDKINKKHVRNVWWELSG